MSSTETHRPQYYKSGVILVGITAVLLLLITQSQTLVRNFYLRYIDYKWNTVELTGLSVNNELQDGFPDYWFPRTWNGGRAEFRNETTGVRTGNFSVRVERTSSGGVAGLSQIFDAPEEATGVFLSVFAKGDGGAAQIRYIFEGRTDVVNGGWRNIPANDDWQQYRIEKQLPAGVSQVEIFLRSKGRIFFDDAYFAFRMPDVEAANILVNPGFEEDGVVQDPFDWWQEHTILPEIGNIPETALAGKLPFLNIIDMLNGRYENIHQRIEQQEAPCSTNPGTISWLLDIGPEVGEKGGASAKEKLLQLAISLAPNCPQPYGQLGQLYKGYGVYLSAAKQFRHAAELSGETPLAGYYYFNEGLIHVRQTGDLEQAVFTLEKAETLDAWVTGVVFQGSPAYNLGLAYKNAGLKEEAAAAFQRVLDCEFCSYYKDDAVAELSALEGEQTN